MSEAAELSGRVAVVTGAAIGIGRAIVTDLAEAGAKVVIADVAGAEKAAAELAEAGHQALGLAVDVSSEEATLEMGRRVAEVFGGTDILVNNAGLFASLTPRPFEEVPIAEWHRVMDVNVLGSFLAARAVVPQMRERGGGRIINIGSTSGFKGTANLVHYSTSKGAIGGFTRALARELGDANILVNAIAPGFTISDGVSDNLDHVLSIRTSVLASRVLHRDMTPADIVGAVRFLAGPSAGFITGQTLVVDGGAYFH